MSITGMKIYTVHVKPNVSLADTKPVFVKEGFNFFAFFLTLFWSLYHRLWLVTLFIIAYNLLIVLVMRWHLLGFNGATALQLGFQFLLGAHANDWLRAALAKRGYIMADVTAADSRLRAEQRYFERYLAAS